MKIICLLLCFLSLTTAKVLPRTGVNNVFDGVEGEIYDVPEYEDPAVSLFKLFARGIMPVYTMRGLFKDSKSPTDKDDKSYYQTDDIKKGLDTVIAQLQETKNKLENGNNRIYLDIDKSVLYLENLKHHLYLDLHADVAVKQFRMSDIIPEESSEKTPMDKYSLGKSALKKYLSSDDSIYKYISLDASTVQPSSFGNSDALSFDSDTAFIPLFTSNVSDKKSPVDYYHSDKQSSESSNDQNLPSEKPLLSDDSIYKDISLDASTVQPSSFGNSGALSFDSDTALIPLSTSNASDKKSPVDYHSDEQSSEFSNDQNLPSEQPLVFDIVTEPTLGSDKYIFKYQFLKPEMSSSVESTPDEKKVMTHVADDVVSSSEDDKVGQGDKTFIRKKWSLKMSSTI